MAEIAPLDVWGVEEIDEMVDAGPEDVGRWAGSMVRFGLMLFGIFT